MPVNPKLQEIINQTSAAHNLPFRESSISQIRDVDNRLALLAGEKEPVQKVLNKMIVGPGGDLLLRLYYPTLAKKLPIVIYLHPGGFVRGNLESHDTVCRSLANAGECLVIALNYRLAPEHPYPAALEDVDALLEWVYSHGAEINGDVNRLAIGGESSGANLAAVTTQIMRDKKGPQIAYQLLIYPQTDFTFHLPSHKTYGKGYLLEAESLEWYSKQYIPEGTDKKTPHLSPLWEGDFSNLPPACIITSEYDPLKDEGEAYAKKLSESGVDTTYLCYKNMIHGFFQLGGVIKEAKEAMYFVGNALKTALK